MASHITTYAEGPEYIITRTLTNKDLLAVCKLLDEAFSREYAGTCSFEPEAITEGGIEWVDWPGKQPEHYKTMRLRFRHYPFVDRLYDDQEIKLHWMDGDNEHAYQKAYPGYKRTYTKTQRKASARLRSMLKAFDDAPAWKTRELDIFAQCFQQVGIEVKRKVTAKSLKRTT